MKEITARIARIFATGVLCVALASCEPPQVYGSVGYSSFSGGYGSPGFGTSVRIGGRIY